MRLRLRLKYFLATPTLAIYSALGVAPLVLQWSVSSYIAGSYGQLQIATDSGFSSITQSLVFLIDGASWSGLDESIGLVTPSGTYYARIRTCRDDENGGTTVTGTDPFGAAVSFLADVSAWSNTITDTINVSSALLTAVAGTSMSRLMTVSGGGLTWTVGAGGAEILSRATISAAHTDFYCEMTVGTIAAGGQNTFGMTDTSIDFNGTGSGFFASGNTIPGDTGLNGFSLFVDGSIWVAYHANGTSGTFNIPSGANAAAGDIIGLEYNSSTNLFTVYYKHAATTMVSIGSLTLTSLIPATPYAFSGGKNSGDSATMNFGATAFTLASSGAQGSPSGSNIYG